MMLSLDEYGCMMRPEGKTHLGRNGRMPATSFYDIDPAQKYVRHDPDDWSSHRNMPPMGDMIGALGTGSVLLTLLRHADRIRIGCATGGLGDLCATSREHVWKRASYYPFTDMIRLARGTSLEAVVSCDQYDVEGYAMDDMNQYEGFEHVNSLQCAAALSPEEDVLTVFMLNADCGDVQEVRLDVRGFEGFALEKHTALFSADPMARNTYENPQAVIPRVVPDTRCEHGTCTAVLPPLSWNVFQFRKAK